MINVFIHIPKCGGSTVRDTILNKCKPRRVLKVYNDNVERDYYTVDSLERHYPNKINDDFAAILGHIPYAKLLPKISPDNCRLFSLVRDPLQREISNINYMKMKPSHSGHKFAISFTNENLFDYLKGKTNMQSSYLGFDLFGSNPSILENISVYKLENYKQSLLDHGFIENLNVDVQIKNVTKQISVDGDVTPELLSISDLTTTEVEYLRELNSRDYELYDLAK